MIFTADGDLGAGGLPTGLRLRARDERLIAGAARQPGSSQGAARTERAAAALVEPRRGDPRLNKPVMADGRSAASRQDARATGYGGLSRSMVELGPGRSTICDAAR